MIGSNVRKIKLFRWLMVIVLVGLLWPTVAYQAFTPFVPCQPWGKWVSSNGPYGGPVIYDECTLIDLLEVPVRIYNWVLGLAGIIFIGVMVWGGTRMMLYYISDSPETELNDAKMTISRGIFGILLIAFSYTVVQIALYTIFGLNSGSLVGGFLQMFGL